MVSYVWLIYITIIFDNVGFDNDDANINDDNYMFHALILWRYNWWWWWSSSSSIVPSQNQHMKHIIIIIYIRIIIIIIICMIVMINRVAYDKSCSIVMINLSINPSSPTKMNSNNNESSVSYTIFSRIFFNHNINYKSSSRSSSIVMIIRRMVITNVIRTILMIL